MGQGSRFNARVKLQDSMGKGQGSSFFISDAKVKARVKGKGPMQRLKFKARVKF